MRKISLCALSFSLMLIMNSETLACSCSEPPPVNTSKKRAAAVFSGRVMQVIIDEARNTYEAKFKVQKSWKGVNAEEVSLFGTTICCICVYEFVAGESYLVYADSYEHEGKKVLGASICSRTTTLKYANDDLKVLGAGRTPKDRKSSPSAAKPNNGMHPTRFSAGVIRQLGSLRGCVRAGDAGR